MRYDRDPFPIRHPYVTVIGALLAIFLVYIFLALVGVVGNYGQEAKRTIDVPNNRQQTTSVLDDENSMIAAAQNYCDARDEAKQQTNGDDPVILGADASSQRLTYNRLKADYDRRMSNFFEARNDRHVPIPGNIGNLPQIAPRLKARVVTVC